MDEVLEKLSAICGRGYLLNHLRQNPVHDGIPTHIRMGNKIIFFPPNLEALKGSLACPSTHLS
jgi:hypothetical protein